MTSFIIAGYVWQMLGKRSLFAPLIYEQPQKCPSWIGLNSLKTLIWTKKCVYKANKIHLYFIGTLCHFLNSFEVSRLDGLNVSVRRCVWEPRAETQIWEQGVGGRIYQNPIYYSSFIATRKYSSHALKTSQISFENNKLNKDSWWKWNNWS